LSAPDPALALASPLGTIVSPDEDDGDLGYYVVELDAPASYDHGVGAPVRLTTIVELIDNLQVTTDAVAFRAGQRTPIVGRPVSNGGDTFTSTTDERTAGDRTVGPAPRRPRRKTP
jgi:hypothetical protein